MYKSLQQQYDHVILSNWLNAINRIVILNFCINSYTIECEENDDDNNNNNNNNSKSNNIKKNDNNNEMNNNKNNIINNANKKSWQKCYT